MSTDPIKTGKPTVTGTAPITTTYQDRNLTASEINTLIRNCVIPDNCTGLAVIKRTWTAKNACGTVTADQYIYRVDKTPPVATSCPQDKTIECPATPSFGTPVFTDTCDANPTVTFTDKRVNLSCGYKITRTWVAKHACGNTSSPVSQTITVTDTKAPTITAPADKTIEAGQTPKFGVPTVSDACDANATYQQVGTDKRVDQGCGYTLTRTWVAKDSCGNTSKQVSQTITVKDTKAPSITAPADKVVECDTEPVFGVPTVTDTCDPNATYEQVGADERVALPYGYKITRTWVAKDSCGNKSGEVSQTIIVVDTVPPVTPDLPEVSGVCEVVVVPPTTTDACDGTVVGTTTDPLVYSVPGTYTVNWTFTDQAGNTITVPQTVVVQDGGGLISGYTFHDLDKTCERTTTSPPLGGLTITLRDADGNIIATTTTNAAGYYEFKGCQLKAGTYLVTAPDKAGDLTLASDGTRVVQITENGVSTDNDFCYRRETPDCYGILLFGPDITWRLYDYMVKDPNGPKMDPAMITIAGTRVWWDPNKPDLLTEALDAKLAKDGKPFCTIYFDTEYFGVTGMWSGLSAADEARLKQEIRSGTGFVYGEPMSNSVMPHAQLPTVLPMDVQSLCDRKQMYTVVDPTSPLSAGLPPRFVATSSCQNINITLLPADGVTYENVKTVAISDSDDPGLANAPGVGGPTVITLDYGANGGRVAILGTDPYPQWDPTPGYETDFASIFRLYYNAIMYTGHLTGNVPGPSPLDLADAMKIAGGLIAAPSTDGLPQGTAAESQPGISIVDAVALMRQIRGLAP